jgi:glycerol-3-phosphate dehydrogenase
VRAPPPPRSTALRRLGDETFDVLVIGAGATGAAVARDAALRGLKVAVVDRGDIAGETSSQSSKLIHGGIRYLEHGHLGLVFEALSERRRLMATAPHLCRPVEFIMPVWREDGHARLPSLAKLQTGVTLYDALALFRPPVKSRRLRPRALYDLAPALRTAGLLGAMGYIDCQTDDSRLVLETALDAEAAGAVLATYVEIEGPLPARRGQLHVLKAVDRGSAPDPDRPGPASRFTIAARAVVNAAGPFSDALRGEGRVLRPTLGVHIVTSAAHLPTGGRAFVVRSPRDGRIMFALPAGSRTMVGTTDTDWPERPKAGDPIRASARDVDYLLESIRHNFPAASVGPDEVLSTFAGLRPLLASDDRNPSATSREHAIWIDRRGILSVAGGKLTTMRRMGEEIVDRLVGLLRERGFDEPIGPCLTRTRPLPGGLLRGELAPPSSTHELAADVEAHLEASFGARAREVLALLPPPDDEGPFSRRLVPDLPHLGAEILFAVQHEHAVEVEDVLCRRVPLFRLHRDQGLGAAELVARELAAFHGGSDARKEASLRRYRALVAGSRAWRNEGPTAVSLGA